MTMFGRYYEVEIEVDGQVIKILPPLNISFALDKSTAGGLNRLTLDIYNLNDDHRLSIVKDPEQIKPMPIKFKLGYEDDYGTQFVGSVFRAYATRRGPNLVTRIESLDGWDDLQSTDISATVDGSEQAINTVIGSLQSITKGKVTVNRKLSSPKVMVGNALKLLRDTIGPDDRIFIDNGQLYVMNKNEVLSSFIPLVSAGTGLLNSPTRQQKKISFETMINPALRMQCMFKLESTVQPHLNGQYLNIQMHYTGEYMGQDWKQSVVSLANPEYTVI